MRAPTEAGGLVGPHLQAFFAEHLLAHKRASPQTIASYRDTFRLLLRFMQGKERVEPSALPLAALDANAVLAFLDHLERDRGCSVRSRNNRLAAIRSFFRVVALRVPDRLGQVTRVMAIPIKRGDKRLVHYLSRDEVRALLAAPDRTVWSGKRDHALLLTMYNTGGASRRLSRCGVSTYTSTPPPAPTSNSLVRGVALIGFQGGDGSVTQRVLGLEFIQPPLTLTSSPRRVRAAPQPSAVSLLDQVDGNAYGYGGCTQNGRWATSNPG